MDNTPFHLNGKTILVTGASSGIGAQAAISISQMGGTVILSGRNEQRLRETLCKLKGESHQVFICDLTDENKVKELAAAMPLLDGVVHCAGIVTMLPVKYINHQKIEETFSINYTASVVLMTYLFNKKKINPQASVVFVSSFSGTFPFSGGALYSGSKAALERYSQALATEHAGAGIRSNCISPALVKTDILEESFKGDRAKYRKQVEEKHLLGFGEPEDVGNLIVFLLSPASKWLTGQNIILDGGYLLGLISKMSTE